jgi:hypothetical protein
MEPNQSKIALLEAPRRGHDGTGQVHESSGAPQSPEKIQIFEKRERTEAANPLIDALTHEDPGISIAQAE